MPKRKLKRPNSNIKRKRKFTRGNRKLIYEALRTGLSISETVKLIGLDRSTYYRWLEKGEKLHYPVHMRFRKKVKKIQAELQLEKLKTILKAAEGGYELKDTKIKFYRKGEIEIEEIIKIKGPCWQAAAWFLERRFPGEWGKKRLLVDEEAPEEKAVQIRAAFDAVMASVPTEPNA